MSGDSADTGQALRQAGEHHQAGRLTEAEKLYRQVLQAQPGQPQASHGLGQLALQAGYVQASVELFRVALQGDPGQGQYWLSYIDALIRTGQVQAAGQMLQQGMQRGLQGEAVQALAQRVHAMQQPATQQEPSTQEAHALVGLLSAGRHVEAESMARALTQRQPALGLGWAVLGAALQAQGRNEAALEPTRKAATLLPDDAEAQSNLGNVLRDLGRLEEAEGCYQRAIAIRPDSAVAHYNRGVALHDLGRLKEAQASFQKTLELKPDLAQAHYNLANVFKGLERAHEAVEHYRRALQINPEMAQAHYNLGVVLQAQEQWSEAEASYAKALSIRPGYAEAHLNRGLVLQALQRSAEAEASYHSAIRARPDYAEAYSNLGMVLRDLGRLEEARISGSRAIELAPDLADPHANLGVTFHAMSRFEEAHACHRRALELKPEVGSVENNLGLTLQALGRLGEAEAVYREILQRTPDYLAVHNNLGVALAEQGRLQEALSCYRSALALQPDHAGVQSNLLFSLNYMDGHAGPSRLDEARKYGRLVAVPPSVRYADWKCDPVPRRLRVGLVSGDLRNHAVGYFLEGLIKQVDPARVELIAFSTHYLEDALTERIKPCFAEWKTLYGLSDAAAAEAIRAERVHVLVDLAGHTAHHRLPVFAYKPAPVQATWLGYFASTGVAEIDYLIADPWTLPTEESAFFTEQIWRLPQTRLCFTPPAIDADVDLLPALVKGYVTFGCFNNLTKINDAVVALWARVLDAVPRSRLYLKSLQLRDDRECQRLRERFARHGIRDERLLLEASVPRADYLAAYGNVDIALDPFPFPGGATSAEALWMGVPVLSLAGDRFISRQGLGLLMNAGLPDWVAPDSASYVSKAQGFAGDLQGLAGLRERLRRQVLASPLFNAAGFARHLEEALWGMWSRRQGG